MAGVIAFKVKITFNAKAVTRPAQKSSEKNLFKAAKTVMTFTKRSLRRSKKSSAPGKPPTVGPKPFLTFNGNRVTPLQAKIIEAKGGEIKKEEGRKAGRLKQAIGFDVNRRKLDAIIGARKSIVGIVGETHEFGKRFRGKKFPKRPYQRPALLKASQNEKIAKFWQDSIRAV